MILVIVCERNTDHEKDWKNIHQQHTKPRQCQKCHVEFFIDQRAQILTEAVDMLPCFCPFLKKIHLPRVLEKQKNVRKDKKNPDNSAQQDQQRIIIIIHCLRHGCRIENLLTLYGSEGR